MHRRSRHLGALTLALFALGVACSPFGSSSSRPAKNTAAITAALDRRVSVDYFQVPLADILDFFTDDTGITVSIDSAALAADDNALDDCQATLKLNDVRWYSVLDLAARQCGVACVVNGNGPRITTRDVAENHLTAVVYPLPILPLDHDTGPPESRMSKAVRSLLDMHWGEPSGALVEAIPGGLLVTHNADGHRKVAQFLSGMCRLAEPPLMDAIANANDLQSPDVAAIRNALARRVTIQVHDEPLQLFLDEIAERQNLNIAVDWRSMHELGVSTDTAVSCDLADVPLDEALRITLFPLGADAWISGEALWIAAADAASWTPTVEVYRLPSDLSVTVSPDADEWLHEHFNVPGCKTLLVPGGLAVVWKSRPDPSLPHALAGLSAMFDPHILPGAPAAPPADEKLNKSIAIDWVDVP